MNFLAHIYLSFDDDEVMLGNFMADGIRGKQYKRYPPGIQKGILLHRAIDTYTDAHPLTRQSSKRLHQNYSHYSRVIVDIYYDHFLAKHWSDYSDVPLPHYVANFYDLLEQNFDLLPEHVQRITPYLIADNWLLSYAKLEGIARVLQGMNRRTRNRSRMDRAITDLETHYSEFEAEFRSFFPDVISFAKIKYQQL